MVVTIFFESWIFALINMTRIAILSRTTPDQNEQSSSELELLSEGAITFKPNKFKLIAKTINYGGHKRRNQFSIVPPRSWINQWIILEDPSFIVTSCWLSLWRVLSRFNTLCCWWSTIASECSNLSLNLPSVRSMYIFLSIGIVQQYIAPDNSHFYLSVFELPLPSRIWCPILMWKVAY